MDESYLTGELFNISKAPGAPALSGAINGEAALTMEAIRASGDSRYARIMRVIQESEQQDLTAHGNSNYFPRTTPALENRRAQGRYNAFLPGGWGFEYPSNRL